MNANQALLGCTAWTLLLVFARRAARFPAGTPIDHRPRGHEPADDAAPVRLEPSLPECNQR
jgi:hypothetical protein